MPAEIFAVLKRWLLQLSSPLMYELLDDVERSANCHSGNQQQRQSTLVSSFLPRDAL